MNKNIKNTILLIIRIIVGGMIAHAGYEKLLDMDNTLVTMSSFTGLSSGFIWAVALGELLSGLGIVFGVWTKLAALGSVIIMIGAVYFTKLHNISALILLTGSILITLQGGGKWALLTHRQKNIN